MRRWGGAMPPKQKLPAPPKSRTPGRWPLFLLFLAIMTPPSPCLSNSSQHGAQRAPICACIRYLTRCAAMRAFKSSWHKILQGPEPTQILGNHPVVSRASTLLRDGRGVSAIPTGGTRDAAVFFCNAPHTFGKKRETACVFGLPGTTATNPKQRKKIIL